jgi:hypothetical protein
MCADCYDYTAAVLFNAHAGELWRRFTTYLPRHLARQAGLTLTAFRDLARIRYVKVAEYQARGVVHFHAVIRLDGLQGEWQPPPGWLTADLLAAAVTASAAAVAIVAGPCDATPGVPVLRLRFGPQTDVRPVRHGGALSVQAVGNYIAKYASKSLDVTGLPDRPVRTAVDINLLRCARHYKAMMLAAWRLSPASSGPPDRYGRWAHMLGYGGHFLTKSRMYSVTFGQLRHARTEHRRQQRHPDGETDPWGRPVDEHVVLILRTFEYASGSDDNCVTSGAELALAAADHARSR